MCAVLSICECRVGRDRLRSGVANTCHYPSAMATGRIAADLDATMQILADGGSAYKLLFSCTTLENSGRNYVHRISGWSEVRVIMIRCDIVSLGRLSPALLGSALLLLLAFGCNMVISMVNDQRVGRTGGGAVRVKVTKKEARGSLARAVMSGFLLTVAGAAAGVATSG